MTTTKRLLRHSFHLSREENLTGWQNFLNAGGYTDDQMNALAGALLDAQVEAFNALLPAGCMWLPTTSEIVGPVDVDIEAALERVRPGVHESVLFDVMGAACEQVEQRFEEIERRALSVDESAQRFPGVVGSKEA